MTDDDLKPVLEKGVENIVKFVVAGERLVAAMRTVRFVMGELQALDGKDPELEPELLAAADHLLAASDALARGVTFAAARAHAEAENL